MALPKLETPTYELTVPSTKKKIKYRPFLVKEEKILLLALESEDDKEIANAMKDLIRACVLTKGIDPDNLATFDVEYIFLNIRGKSIGETIDVKILCPDDEKTEITTQIPIDKINVRFTKGHTNQIQVSDDLWVEMKYPNIDSLAVQEETVDDTFKLVSKSIKKIYNAEDVWDSSTTTEDEFMEFIESMNSKQFAKIQKFFTTMPSLKHTVKIINPNTRVKSEYTIEGLSNFFI
tara:strand:- start:3455 stop:4156 length:702 start_codon:yes stop_codon:yes gene_type:complete